MVLRSKISRSSEILRTALAIGADSAILVQTDKELDKEIQPVHVSNIIKQIVQKHKFDFVLMGKQAIDDDFNQTAQMLSAYLNWPQATFISKLDYNQSSKTFLIEREIEGGIQKLEIPLNCVISCDLRLNKPRLPKLPDIMKAKKKPLEIINISEFDLSKLKSIQVSEVAEPTKRKAGVMLSSVDELIAKLRTEAKVI